MDLSRDAMLVSLRISAWSGRLYDREASDTSPPTTKRVRAPAGTTSGFSPRRPWRRSTPS